MSSTRPKAPRQAKLRSSCDACGASKLKCDREQPECKRCVSYGIPCVYGLSRKMGKPPRDRLRSNSTTTSTASATPTMTPTTAPSSPNGQPGAMSRDGERRESSTSVDAIPFSNSNDMSAVWDTVMDDNTTLVQPGPSVLSYGSLDFGDWPLSDLANDHQPFGSFSTPESPEFSNYSPTAPLRLHYEALGIADHDCARQAYEILGNLSWSSISKNLPISSSSATNSVFNDMPLDQVLRLNREASKRLSSLLNCPCAHSTNMAMLYASCLTKILTCYQQLAACAQGASWSPASTTLDTTSHHVSPVNVPGPDFAFTPASSTWSSTTPSTFSTSGTDTPPLSASSKMAIGTFDVDDQRVQTALKIQLLLGEMRRTGSLIDQFVNSHDSDGQSLSDNSEHGTVESLYQSLDSWLTGEHERIANMMRAKLRELNT